MQHIYTFTIHNLTHTTHTLLQYMALHIQHIYTFIIHGLTHTTHMGHRDQDGKKVDKMSLFF